MDYLAFTRNRIEFLKYFYAEASQSFLETRRKIEAYEPPFEAPPGYEDGEPPFLDEWGKAGDALDVLGQSVASLLSERLHLYVKHWIKELRERAGDAQLIDLGIGLPEDPALKRIRTKRGWLAAYREYCLKLEVDWTHSGADLDLLEQLTLARNTVQHPEDITSIRARQTETDAERHPEGVFVDAFELAANASTLGHKIFWPPRLEVSAEKLAKAFDEVERLCVWMDAQHPMRAQPRS